MPNPEFFLNLPTPDNSQNTVDAAERVETAKWYNALFDNLIETHMEHTVSKFGNGHHEINLSLLLQTNDGTFLLDLAEREIGERAFVDIWRNSERASRQLVIRPASDGANQQSWDFRLDGDGTVRRLDNEANFLKQAMAKFTEKAPSVDAPFTIEDFLNESNLSADKRQRTEENMGINNQPVPEDDIIWLTNFINTATITPR